MADRWSAVSRVGVVLSLLLLSLGGPCQASQKEGTTSLAAAMVLPSTRFKLPVSLGYKAAAGAKDVVKQLFCYCGCDRTDDHTSLLDCFTSVHGAYCPICQEEAIEAAKLKSKNVPLKDIQKQIDNHYAKRYPFPRPSAQLLKYRRQLGKLSPLPSRPDMSASVKSSCCRKS